MKKISREHQITRSVIVLKLLPENYIIFLQFCELLWNLAISTSVEFYLPEDHLELDYQASLPIDRYQQNIA